MVSSVPRTSSQIDRSELVEAGEVLDGRFFHSHVSRRCRPLILIGAAGGPVDGPDRVIVIAQLILTPGMIAECARPDRRGTARSRRKEASPFARWMWVLLGRAPPDPHIVCEPKAFDLGKWVELRGIEPRTSSMRTKRATNCATAPWPCGSLREPSARIAADHRLEAVTARRAPRGASGPMVISYPALNESPVSTGTRRDTSTCAATAISSL